MPGPSTAPTGQRPQADGASRRAGEVTATPSFPSHATVPISREQCARWREDWGGGGSIHHRCARKPPRRIPEQFVTHSRSRHMKRNGLKHTCYLASKTCCGILLRFTFPFKDLQPGVSHTLARRAAVVPGRSPQDVPRWYLAAVARACAPPKAKKGLAGLARLAYARSL